MATNLPNSLYVPTGTAFGRDYIQYEGYCYKKISDNVVLSNQTIRNDIFGDYDDCVDCNSCECPKTIDFIVGGFQYSGSDIQYRENTISIQTSSTGWQEIAIESGYLNGNHPSVDFKPVQIRCYDRKIDMRSGIYVSFDDRQAEIAHFNYVSGADLYEREDMYYKLTTGEFGEMPNWNFLNQYDKVCVANKVNTIKFKSLCEKQCDTQDITFRIRGTINESLSYLNLGSDYDNVTSSWIYATCTGVPNTPGQIIDCIPSGSGINFTDYFTQGYTGYAGNANAGNPVPRDKALYTVQFAPTEIEVVNMPLLLGDSGSRNAKQYSITGNKHFPDYRFDIDSFTNNLTQAPIDPNNYFYYAIDNINVDFDFAEEIGKKYSIDYNKPSGCFDSSIINSDFNSYYRHLGGNRVAEQASLGTAKGDIYTGCFQTSEYADGIFKNGTYVPMFFTGWLTGNATEYQTFIDDTEGSPPAEWRTGVYVYQWYKSGDRSDANSNIDGFFGFLSNQQDPEVHKHYSSVLYNHGPVNMGTPLKLWDIQSGNFPVPTANKIDTTFVLNFNNNLAYQYAFKTFPQGVRHSGDNADQTTTTTTPTSSLTTTTTIFGSANAYDNYNFRALGGNSMMEYLNEPLFPTNTFVKPVNINELFPITDSGNPLHDAATSPIDYTTEDLKDPIQLTELKNIKFQLSWKK
jgi:hypothetical protein